MKLFWRIFLSFWLATILMIAAVLGVSEFIAITFPGDSKTGFQPAATDSALTNAVNIYEKQGASGLLSALPGLPAIRYRHLYLAGADGKDLIKDGNAPPLYRKLAQKVLETGRSEMYRPFGLRLLYACPIQSATGQRYAAVITVLGPGRRLLRAHFWFNVAVAMFPSALVCLILSFYITHPITRLRATARRLAEGDLAARSSPHRITRRDELGDLARDFDMMAGRIQQLMTAQRRFVADVSHELGAPLTRMYLAQALLRRESGKTGAALERIERETDTLSGLVHQLLLLAGMARANVPRKPCRRFPCNLCAGASSKTRASKRITPTAESPAPAKT